MKASHMVSPALEFYDLDGVRRVSLDVEYPGSPGLSFFSEEGTQEIALGQTLSRAWGLYIGKPHVAGKEVVDFASLEVGPSGSELSILDDEGFETRIGAIDLVTPRTGETHKTSAASVVLFDKDKKVLWKAP